MCSGVTVTGEPGVGKDPTTGHAPMGNYVRAVRYAAPGDRDMKQERLDRGDLHLDASLLCYLGSRTPFW